MRIVPCRIFTPECDQACFTHGSCACTHMHTHTRVCVPFWNLLPLDFEGSQTDLFCPCWRQKGPCCVLSKCVSQGGSKMDRWINGEDNWWISWYIFFASYFRKKCNSLLVILSRFIFSHYKTLSSVLFLTWILKCEELSSNHFEPAYLTGLPNRFLEQVEGGQHGSFPS